MVRESNYCTAECDINTIVKKFYRLFFSAISLAILFSGCRNSVSEISQERSAFKTDQSGSTMAEEILVEDSSAQPLSIQIEYLLSRDFPGSKMEIERELHPGSNYEQFIASYDSDGLQQFGLLTVPVEPPPENGFPVIIFNHGYIDPEVYRTTERYGAYVDYFARNGYVVFKPDYRGHDQSEGEAQGGYGNADYIVDVLNAVSSVRTLDQVNPDAIGMWGHSMGGWITHRAMIASADIKAGVIWAGMVGGYDDLLELRQPYWVRNGTPEPSPDPDNPRRRWRRYLTENYGQPEENPEFWQSISAVPYLDRMAGPIQLHHATGDDSVPAALSERFFENLESVSPESELYIYQGDDHNISANFSTAMQRSLSFFDQHLPD